MTGGRWAAAAAVALCWLFALYLAIAPVQVDDPVPAGAGCPRPVPGAFLDEGLCSEPSQKRLGVLVAWLVITGGVSTAFVASCALAGRRTE